MDPSPPILPTGLPRTVPAFVHRRASPNTRALPPPPTISTTVYKVSYTAPNLHETIASSSFIPKTQAPSLQEKWKTWKLHCQECALRGASREYILSKENRNRCSNSDGESTEKESQMRKSTQEEASRLKEFHEETIFAYIERSSQQDTTKGESMLSRSAVYIDDVLLNMERILLGVEQTILFRCYDFDPVYEHRNVKPPKHKNERMVRIFERLQTILMKEIAASRQSKNDIKATVLNKMADFGLNGGNRYILVDQYLSALSEHLVEVLTRDVDLRVDPPEYSSPDALARRYADWERFIEWVNKTLIIENRDQFGEVSLFFIKGDIVNKVEKPSPEELGSLGWRLDGPNYWRYSMSTEKSLRHEMFKVQMDGEVVGIWTADGDINWDPSLSED